MSTGLVEGIFTLAFGGGTTAIVAYVYWKNLKTITQSHQETIETITKSHKETVENIVKTHDSETKSICDSFKESNDQRTKDIQMMMETFKNKD
jgi:hypothetical protein